MKGLNFVGTSLDDLRAFPDKARQSAGHQLHLVQLGDEPNDWKPLKTVGQGVREEPIRIAEDRGAFRVIYVANIGEVVYVLHAFQKKTEQTRQADIDLARRRFKQVSQGVGRGKGD